MATDIIFKGFDLYSGLPQHLCYVHTTGYDGTNTLGFLPLSAQMHHFRWNRCVTLWDVTLLEATMLC